MFQGVAPLPDAAAYFTDLIARGVVVPERLVGALAVRYSIERELGARGMATVYLPHDLRLAPVGGDARELYYQTADGRIMVMRANVGADLATAEPRALFRAHLDCAARLTAASGFTGREDWPRAAGGS